MLLSLQVQPPHRRPAYIPRAHGFDYGKLCARPCRGPRHRCKMGFMQRPERVVLTTVALLATGITGCIVGNDSSFDPNFILIFAMGFLALFANMTAIARINHCRKAMLAQEEAEKRGK